MDQLSKVAEALSVITPYVVSLNNTLSVLLSQQQHSGAQLQSLASSLINQFFPFNDLGKK
jgi:hypothetical protein